MSNLVGDEDFTDDERYVLTALSESLTEFVRLRPNMPLHQIIVMLAVAVEEGKSLKQYSVEKGIPASSVSRTFLDNGPKMRSGEDGLGLLEARSSFHDLREYRTYLSERGRLLFRSIAHRLMLK